MARTDVSAPEAVERLSVEDVAASTLSASEHTHRYRWAARLVGGGMRVLDLCCGVGYGSAILASGAGSVTGVDVSQEAIEEAREAEAVPGVTFEVADAMAVLDEPDLRDRFDAVVCFEGLEHLPDLERAIDRLAAHASAGMRVLASLPNSKTFGEENPFHVTDPDLEVALRTFERLPGAVIGLQYVAEGSLIAGFGPDEAPRPEIALLDRVEPEYANNFLVAVNVPAEELAEGLDGLARLTLSPYYNRHLGELQRANDELWHVNKRLGRQLRDLAADRDLREPAWEALRQGQSSAGRTLSRMAARTRELEAQLAATTRELDAKTAELDAKTAEQRHRIWELEVELNETAARVGQLEDDAAVAWGRYHELRDRRVVKLALRAGGIFRRGG